MNVVLVFQDDSTAEVEWNKTKDPDVRSTIRYAGVTYVVDSMWYEEGTPHLSVEFMQEDG